MTDQPTLGDGGLVLRPWRDDDPDPGPDGTPRARAREAWADGSGAVFVLEHAGDVVGTVAVDRLSDPRAGASDQPAGELSWALAEGHQGRGHATRGVRALTDWALTAAEQGGWGLGRVQARVAQGDDRSHRVVTRAGLRHEGVQRAGDGRPGAAADRVVLSRLATDPPLSEPGAFRALLNSFLPRKRAIAQLLVRDHDQRVLLCGLTYKSDWDLPGGVVEVGESPHLAASREVVEELALDLAPGRLLLTDWLPPWGGWDDAVCLVFDGGEHDARVLDAVVKQAREIRDVAFCTPAQVRERAADFTARRVEAALAALAGTGPAYTESGREPGRA